MSVLEHSDDSRAIGYFILPHKKIILLVDSIPSITVHCFSASLQLSKHNMPLLESAAPSSILTLADFEEASKYAIRVSKEISSYSKLADNRDGIPLLERDEVVLGDLLGSGGFNNVYEVHAIELLTPESGGTAQYTHLTSTPTQAMSRRMLAKRRDGELAVKFLNESCKTSAEEYGNGAADLLLETRYLSALASYPHPNIIRLHGVAAAGAQGFSTGAEGSYFLVLDRLADTLDSRIEVWKELERRKKVNLSPEFELHLKALFVKQLQVGVDLASALSHLHKLRIIFRDLKVRTIIEPPEPSIMLCVFRVCVQQEEWILNINMSVFSPHIELFYIYSQITLVLTPTVF